MRRCKSLPGSPGKVSRGHFSSRTQAGHVPALAKIGTQKSKVHKLTQNVYRVLLLCINNTQDENMPGKMGEMKAKMHFHPDFLCLRCSSMLAGLQHVPLMGRGTPRTALCLGPWRWPVNSRAVCSPQSSSVEKETSARGAYPRPGSQPLSPFPFR